MKKFLGGIIVSLVVLSGVSALLPAKANAIFGIAEYQPCGNGAPNCWDVLLENGKLVRVTGP